MTEHEAIVLVKKALDEVSPGSGGAITPDSDLVKDEILDSLDLMNFLFELEELYGSKIEEITETFDDYRVSTLIGFISDK